MGRRRFVVEGRRFAVEGRRFAVPLLIGAGVRVFEDTASRPCG